MSSYPSNQCESSFFYQRFQGAFFVWAVFSAQCVLTSLFFFFEGEQGVSSVLSSHFTLSTGHIKEAKVWTLLSYLFFHESFVTLAFACLPIFWVYPRLRHYYSEKELILFYCASGLAGALLHLLVSPEHEPIHGAFGVGLGFLVLYSRFAPDRPLFRFFSLSINSRGLIALLVLLDLVAMGLSLRIDHSSMMNHLGIFFYCFYVMSKEDRSEKVGEKPSEAPHEPTSVEIDAILDKISEHGIQSLTSEERDCLERASHKSG